MIVHIIPSALHGSIAAIPSKSEAHRALICAALADKPTRIEMAFTSQDIEATIRCLTAFGARIDRDEKGITVKPIKDPPTACKADCGESGSTLRFLLPVAAALGIDTTFVLHGRLPQRPIFPLDRELERGQCVLERPQENLLRVHGRLVPGAFELPGNVSSQYISGMLLALSIPDSQSTLAVTGNIESAPYINMTLHTMERFGVAIGCGSQCYSIPGGRPYRSMEELAIGGDWSNAAFWICIDAAERNSIDISGLDPLSAQGDKRVTDVVRSLQTNDVTVFDASDAPDLVPALAACACILKKELHVVKAGRLRLKESDRIASVANALNALGGHVVETADGMIILPSNVLTGGTVDAAGDHRIAMMAAVASVGCTQEVTVLGADAVRKSYPEFWNDFAALGGSIRIETEV